MLKPLITLSRALTEPALFGKVFASPSFWTWRVVAKLIDGIPLTEPREIALFEECTGCTYDKHARRAVRRMVILVGRRGGKDRFLSAVAVWRAALCADWRKFQSAGEGAVVILLGADKKQAAILRRYCHGLLQVQQLAVEITRDTNEVIEFRNGASLEIATNDARLVRGRSAIAVLGSEASHWKTDEHASSSDEEVVAAAEPSMAMCPDDGLLLLGSSVYRKRGYMYRMYKKLHGNNDSDEICWFAPSTTMNPQLRQSIVDKALADNAAKASAEYLGHWREDLSDCFPLDAIEACTDWAAYERPPLRGVSYVAFCDAATGTGSDSFTLAIAHRNPDSNTVVLDALRERKPRFVAFNVVAEYAELLKRYGITEVYGDSFARGIIADEWRRNQITFRDSENVTSDNYLKALPLVSARRVVLLNNATLRNQLTSLERFVSGTREGVRHPQVASAHDDVATACCGALVVASSGYRYTLDPFAPDFVDRDTPDADASRSEADAWQMQRYVMLFGGLV